MLVPAYTDEDSGYRYYAPRQVRIAEQIRLLREADLPLGEVRRAIDEPERLPELLARHERALLARITQAERALALLRFLREKEEETVTVSPEMREVPQRLAAVVEAQTAPDRIGADLPRAYAELAQLLEKAGLAPQGPALAGYPEADFDPESFIVVAGFPVDREPPEGVPTREFPGGRAVVATVRGPYDGITRGWQQTWGWLAEQGMKVRAMPYEVYRVDHLQAPSPQEMETDLVLPVE